MNSESREERKLRMNRERQQRWRDRQSQDTLQRLAQRNTKYKHQRRAHEDPEEAKERRAQITDQVRLSRSIQRAKESEEQTAARLFQASQQRQQSRTRQQAEESEEQAAARRQQAVDQVHQSRATRQAQESEEQAAARRQLSSIQRQRLRNQRFPVVPTHATFNESEVTIHSCGSMDQECIHCLSLNFLAEKSTDGTFKYCCHKGTVLLESDGQQGCIFPSYLQELLSNPAHPQYRNFQENIRSYNSAVAFASMGAQIDNLVGRGPYVFRVHGQIYHRTGHMHPEDGAERQYAQFYVVDSAMANVDRMQHPANQRLNVSIVQNLDRLI